MQGPKKARNYTRSGWPQLRQSTWKKLINDGADDRFEETQATFLRFGIKWVFPTVIARERRHPDPTLPLPSMPNVVQARQNPQRSGIPASSKATLQNKPASDSNLRYKICITTEIKNANTLSDSHKIMAPEVCMDYGPENGTPCTKYKNYHFWGLLPPKKCK